MNLRHVRFLPICFLMSLTGCGYFSTNWPTLEQDPLPERPPSPSPADTDPGAEDSPPPARAGQSRPIESVEEAEERLADHEARLATLRMRADGLIADLNETPQTPAQWGQAQVDASRLTREEGNLRLLRDDISRDAGHMEQQAALEEEATRYRSLSLQVASLLDRVAARRREAETMLARHRPEDQPAPAAPATPLPQGRPALTIAADAEPETYSQAVTTLVEKAQAINDTNVYHVVAAPDETAAMRAENVRSLLAAGGIAQPRIRMLTDPAGEMGSVRIFVE